MPEKRILWGVLAIYMIILSYTSANHEPWFDEIHAWNLARGSASLPDLIRNTRYEGHPRLWFTLLWALSHFTHDMAYIHVMQVILAGLAVSMVLFFSPFPLVTRVLIPFGYYFLYEFTVFIRNYTLGLLLAFGICLIIRKDFKYKFPVYYTLLFLLSNTHLLTIILAGSLHLYFLLWNVEQQKKASILAGHMLAGALVLLPSLYFTFPASGNAVSVWGNHFLPTLGRSPLWAFIPVPAWWQYHFWNTQFLLEMANGNGFLRAVIPLLSIILLAGTIIFLRKEYKSMVVMAANMLLTLVISTGSFTLSTSRYVGFIYIGFLAAYWLYCYEIPSGRPGRRWINMLLVIQAGAAVFPVYQDIRLPFSNLYRLTELIKEVPEGEKWTSDYWAMSAAVAYTGKPVYCIDMEKEMSFVLWGKDIPELLSKPHRYCEGISFFFRKEKVKTVYIISTAPLKQISTTDTLLQRSFTVRLVDAREGAIDNGSDLYLYQVSQPTTL